MSVYGLPTCEIRDNAHTSKVSALCWLLAFAGLCLEKTIGMGSSSLSSSSSLSLLAELAILGMFCTHENNIIFAIKNMDKLVLCAAGAS